MSMYNMVVGHDPAVGLVLQTLGFTPETMETIPRFRDAYIDVGDPQVEEEPRLVLLTRTGGGNREAYEQENEALRQRPGFLDDFDDDFDPTFAHFRYAVPEARREEISKAVAEGREAGWGFPKPMERFQKAVASL